MGPSRLFRDKNGFVHVRLQKTRLWRLFWAVSGGRRRLGSVHILGIGVLLFLGISAHPDGIPMSLLCCISDH
jgi:hypothetical protein